MAKKIKSVPNELSNKLRKIRMTLGYTQREMYEALEREGAVIYAGYVGLYENNDRLPSLMVVLAYARVAGISTDLLIDDNLQLP